MMIRLSLSISVAYTTICVGIKHQDSVDKPWRAGSRQSRIGATTPWVEGQAPGARNTARQHDSRMSRHFERPRSVQSHHGEDHAPQPAPAKEVPLVTAAAHVNTPAARDPVVQSPYRPSSPINHPPVARASPADPNSHTSPSKSLRLTHYSAGDESSDGMNEIAQLALPSRRTEQGRLTVTQLARARLGNRLFQISGLLSIAKEANAKVALPFSPRYNSQNTPQYAKLGDIEWLGPDVEWLSDQSDKCHIWDRTPVTVDWGLSTLGNWTLAGTPKGTGHVVTNASAQPKDNWAKLWADALVHTQVPGSPCKIVELDGFWQKAEFFVHHLDWIRQLFWHDETAERARELLGLVLPNGVKDLARDSGTVALHLRLGDYVAAGRNMEMTYYEDALREVRQRNGGRKLTCLVFSDDIKLASEVMLEIDGCDARIPVGHCSPNPRGEACARQYRISDQEQFYMMSQVPNIVIADSTYSFWSAVLAHPEDNLVVAPRISNEVKVRTGEYSYLNSIPGWINIDVLVGATNSTAVKKAISLNRDMSEAALSEWSA